MESFRHNFPADFDADVDLNCLQQFFSCIEMQTFLSENLFLEEDSLPALLGLSSSSGGSEVFFGTEDLNGSLAGVLQAAGQIAPQAAVSSLTGIEPATCPFAAIPSDLAFVERAANYSSFVKECGIKAEESAGNGDGGEIAFVSAVSGSEVKYGKRKKRKNIVEAVSCEELKGKRCKSAENEKNAVKDSKHIAERSNNIHFTGKTEDARNGKTEDARNVKATAPPEIKDYIHVRAPRGQATDSHSLAERARREKISKRMKVLQDLVPGCNKSTSKVLMLDEIINHVQSLQRQVEFLSMKLATCNPLADFDLYRFSC